MKLGKSILKPSYLRKPDFNSLSSATSTFEFNCNNCAMRIVREFRIFIGLEFGWAEHYDATSLMIIETHFGMNIVGKSPDGGMTAVTECDCKTCGSRYLLYAGVNEYANSAYQVTLQGITEIVQ